MAAKDKGIDEQNKALIDYIDKELATHKLVMHEIVEGAKVEFAAQRMNLQTLYEATTKELEAVKDRLEEAERKDSHNGKGKFLTAKHMLPRTLEKQDEWKQWKSEVEDYCEVVMQGTKEVQRRNRGKRSERNMVEDTIRHMEVTKKVHIW